MFVCFNHKNHKDELNKAGDPCSCEGSIQGKDFHVFNSRAQGGKDLAEVRCSKAGGAVGCGQKGHIKLWEESSQNTDTKKEIPKGSKITGNAFDDRLKSAFTSKVVEPTQRLEVKKEKGLIIPLQLINILHLTLLDRIKSFFGWEEIEFDKRTIGVLDEALADIIRSRIGETESSPEMTYLSTWGMVILTGIMKGGINRKREEPEDEDNKPDEA